MEELFLGKKWQFKGLKQTIETFFMIQFYKLFKNEQECSFANMDELSESFEIYQDAINFIIKKAKGEIPTYAAWIRDLVKHHKVYKFDNIINDEIAYDISRITADITAGKISPYRFYNNIDKNEKTKKIIDDEVEPDKRKKWEKWVFKLCSKCKRLRSRKIKDCLFMYKMWEDEGSKIRDSII